MIAQQELTGPYRFLYQVVPVLMGVYIFFVPIPHSTAIKEISFYLSLAATLVLVASKKIRFSFESPLTAPLLLFAAWAVVGLFSALYRWNSFHDFIFLFLKYLALYYILVNFFQSRRRVVILSWVIVASLAVFSFGGILHFYGHGGYELQLDRIDYLEMEINIIGYPALFAILLGIALLPIARSKAARGVLLMSMAGTALVALLTRSRGTLLGLIFSLLLLFPRRKVLVSLASLFVAALILVLPVKDRLTPHAVVAKLQTDDRVLIWMTYLEVVKDFPIMGIGFGMEMWKDQTLWDKYSSRLPPEKRTIMQDPQNLLVSILTRLGIVGLVIWLCVLISFAKMGWQVVREGKDDFVKDFGVCLSAAYLAYFIKGMFEPALSHVPAIVSYVIFAMMTILWRMQKEDPAR